MASRKLIKALEKKRVQLLQTLLHLSPVIPGSFKKVYRQCGKSNCWCHKGKGHPLKRITWTEHGRSCSKAVKDDYIDWVIHATDNYRKFRMMKKKLLNLELETHTMLDCLLKESIKKSRQEKNMQL